MADDTFESPEFTALARLRERVERDEQLPDAIKQAVLADLQSGEPATFNKLKAALTAAQETHEDRGTQSA